MCVKIRLKYILHTYPIRVKGILVFTLGMFPDRAQFRYPFVEGRFFFFGDWDLLPLDFFLLGLLPGIFDEVPITDSRRISEEKFFNVNVGARSMG